jgi:hypothetical protein
MARVPSINQQQADIRQIAGLGLRKAAEKAEQQAITYGP